MSSTHLSRLLTLALPAVGVGTATNGPHAISPQRRPEQHQDLPPEQGKTASFPTRLTYCPTPRCSHPTLILMTSSLRIKQQNCRKSKAVALSLISTVDPALWDMVLLQEPYIYPGSRLTAASPSWNVIYPMYNPDETHAPSSIILLNANISSQYFHQIPIQSHLVMAVSFHPDGDALPITLLNIYNPPGSDLALDAVSAWVNNLPSPPPCMLWAGDFNKHHPMWAGAEHPQRCAGNGAAALIQAVLQFGLSLRSPCGIPTFRSDAHGTWSTLDLVLSTDDMEGLFLKCQVDHADALPGADHLPIHSVIDSRLQRRERTRGRNFREVDWADFTRSLRGQMQLNGVTDSPKSAYSG